MSIKFTVFGKKIVIGLNVRQRTGWQYTGPFITIGNYSYSFRGRTDLAALSRELGFS